VGLEGLGKLKNPMTAPGIEPVTFQLVTQCLNQLCHHVPLPNIMILLKMLKSKDSSGYSGYYYTPGVVTLSF
jgi:hypothetical protein